MSFANAASVGVPSSARCATRVRFAIAGTSMPLASMAGSADSGSSPAANTWTSIVPAAIGIGSVRVPGSKPGMASSPFT